MRRRTGKGACLEALLLLQFVELGHELDGANQFEHPDEPEGPGARTSAQTSHQLYPLAEPQLRRALRGSCPTVRSRIRPRHLIKENGPNDLRKLGLS